MAGQEKAPFSRLEEGGGGGEEGRVVLKRDDRGGYNQDIK